MLTQANKGHWLTARAEKIQAKGKGELQTYWLEIGLRKSPKDGESTDSDESSSFSSSEEELDDERDPAVIVLDERSQRLVDWVVDQLGRLLKQILARRRLLGIKSSDEVAKMQVLDFSDGGTCIDEVKDVVNLNPFDPKAVNFEAMADVIVLPSNVISQLRDFVATIATLYLDNPFHNFAHATVSTDKYCF